MLKWARNPPPTTSLQQEKSEDKIQEQEKTDDGETSAEPQPDPASQRIPRLFGSLRLGRKQNRRRNSISELPAAAPAASKPKSSTGSNDAGPSLKRWITGSLRRLGRLRRDSNSGAASDEGAPSLRRSRSADRCGSRGSCESMISPAAAAAQHRGASESAVALADFAETAAVICQLLGSDSTADRQSIRYLVDAAVNSPISASFSRTFDQLTDLGLSEDAFALTSVIGQELLAAGQARRAAVCLECALRIGGDGPEARLRCSVTASLGRAHWLLGGWDSAVDCMKRHLRLAESCSDPAEQSRALGNLTAALSALGRSAEALRFERRRLRLRLQDSNPRLSSNPTGATSTLRRLYAATGEAKTAMTSQRKSARQCHQDLEDSESPLESTAVDDAERLSERQRRITQRLENREAAAEALASIDTSGRCHAARGDHPVTIRRTNSSSCRSLGQRSDSIRFERQRTDLSEASSRVDSLESLADIIRRRGRDRQGDAASVLEAYKNLLSAVSEAQRCHGDSETLRNIKRQTNRRFGCLYLGWGKPVDAERCFQESMSDSSGPSNALEVAKATRGLAGSLLLQGRLPEAESAIKHSLTACAQAAAEADSSSVGSAKAKSKAFSGLAAIRERLGDLPGALRHRQAALEAARLFDNSKLLQTALGDLGDANLAAGNVASCLRCHHEAVKATQTRDAAAICRLAGALMLARHWGEAAEQLEGLLELLDGARKQNDADHGNIVCRKADVLRSLGDCNQSLRKQTAAIGFYERCLDVLAAVDEADTVERPDWKAPQSAGIARLQALRNSESCSCDSCNSGEVSNLATAPNASESTDAMPSKWLARAIVLSKLSECHRLCVQIQEGLVCVEKCLALASSARPDSVDATSTDAVVADAYEIMGRLLLRQSIEAPQPASADVGDDLQRAGDCFAAQLTAARRIRCRAREAAAAGWLGLARQLAGRRSESVAWHRAALAAAPDRLVRMRARAALAASLRNAGDAVAALETIEDSHDDNSEIDDRQDYESGYSPTYLCQWQLLRNHQRGLALEQLGRLEEARNALMTAITAKLEKLDEPSDNNLFDSANKDEDKCVAVGECLDGLQRILAALGDWRSALEQAERRLLLFLGESWTGTQAVETLQCDLGDCEAVLCLSRAGERQLLGWLVTPSKRGGDLVARSEKIDPSCPENIIMSLRELVHGLCCPNDRLRSLTVVASPELMLLMPRLASGLIGRQVSAAMAPSLHHCVRWRKLPRSPKTAAPVEHSYRILAFTDNDEEQAKEFCAQNFLNNQQEIKTVCIFRPLPQLKQIGAHATEVIHLSMRLPTSALEIEGLAISARLVVISLSAESFHKLTSSQLASLIELSDSLLTAGTRAVLISLWPSLLSQVYSKLLAGRSDSGGGRIAEAINSAMAEHSNDDGVPSNPLILLGDVRTRLPTATSSLGRVLRSILLADQRVGDIGMTEVRRLFRSLLRFLEGTERPSPFSRTELEAAAARIRALVSLPDPALPALRRLLVAVSSGGDCQKKLARLFEEASKSATSATCLTVPSTLWRRDGCHDLLSAVGFRLCSLGADDGNAQLMLLSTAPSASSALLLGNASLSLFTLADADETADDCELLRDFHFATPDQADESIADSSLCRRRRRCQPPAVVQSTVSWDSSSGYGSGWDFPGSP